MISTKCSHLFLQSYKSFLPAQRFISPQINKLCVQKTSSRHYSPKPQQQQANNRNPQKSNWLLALLGVGIAATTYIVYNYDEVPISGRKRLLSVSRTTELNFAKQSHNEMNKLYKDQLLPENHEHVKTVTKVGENIIKSSGLKNLSSIPWNFQVINSNELRAMALPNGQVFVCS